MSVVIDRACKAARRLAAVGMATILASGALGAAQAATKIGWLWADQPTQTNVYTPDTGYSFSSVGGDISIQRQSKGVYAVTMNGLGGSDPSDILVTAYGGTGGYCAVGSWDTSTDTHATIRCYDRHGAAGDNYFTMLFQSHSGTFGDNVRGTAFLWADKATKANYTPSTTFQFNSTGGVNTVHRNGAGNYSVQIPGLDRISGHVQVSAYGSAAARCKTSGWEQGEAGTNISVLCFDVNGEPADEQYTLVYTAGMPMAYLPSQTQGVYAWANKEKVRHVYRTSPPYQFNNLTTGKLTAQRGAKGGYTVNIPGDPVFDSSNELVTAYGSDNSYCNVVNWLPLLAQCYTQNGFAIDSKFDVSFQTQIAH